MKDREIARAIAHQSELNKEKDEVSRLKAELEQSAMLPSWGKLPPRRSSSEMRRLGNSRSPLRNSSLAQLWLSVS